ncbi:OLC1v1018003C1 [Oldenlandia corymbosa var. corymbosa]|uniref:OLC1v1018003C1 n=1 Tax=Oldenlandia corymbosa var. corymbosa TaxID=529605 RepID=A0AAV1EAQ1_OLDCO|nr:OLC1v1018003C1 [Oldenlandia corymbosa var. corymbosa]
MGSLMAGWDSPVPDPRLEKLRRNSSLTRDEIQAFWRSRKAKEEEHLRDISSLSPRSQELVFEDARRRNQRSSSLPLPDTNDDDFDMKSDQLGIDKLIQKNGWWISSNWAFLNEPPVIGNEGRQYKYASQFHVANMGPSSHTHNAQTGVGA